jgi:hypothetical protein
MDLMLVESQLAEWSGGISMQRYLQQQAHAPAVSSPSTVESSTGTQQGEPAQASGSGLAAASEHPVDVPMLARLMNASPAHLQVCDQGF